MAQRASPIVANILTGFLGAGKTTLLNALLSSPDLSDTAVIINEFGSIGIDHLLVESVGEDTVVLQSGCICCTIRGDLRQAILSLFDKRKAGLVPAFRRLVIETTGLADPAPIIATMTADLMLKYHFTMGNIIAVVDAPNGRHTLENHPESARQVAVADRIVVTKTDLAGDETVRDLMHLLSSMNPAATLEAIDPRRNAASLLLTEDIHDLDARGREVRRWISAERFHDHAHAPAGDVNRHGTITATAITASHALSWPRFASWLSMLVNRHGERILRLKGIVEIEGQDAPVVVHGVQHLIHKPTHFNHWPQGRRQTVLVFITEGPLGDLDRSFRAFNPDPAEAGVAGKTVTGP